MQGLQGDGGNEASEHDIEAIDSVRIEGVECVLQVSRRVIREDICVDMSMSYTRYIHIYVNIYGYIHIYIHMYV